MRHVGAPRSRSTHEPRGVTMTVVVATESEILLLEAGGDVLRKATGVEPHRPTCLAASARSPGQVWCGTARGGVFRSDDGGASWRPAGLDDVVITAIALDPVDAGVVWAGSEPSEMWRSADGGRTWERTTDLSTLPSSPEWAFPPRPETHHVRWIACHPHGAGRLWVAIEAGALVSTADGGRTWHDRVPGGPYDTHELAIHPDSPESLRVAAGDGYFESPDGGRSWERPRDGLDVGYLRSVAIDPGQPDIVVVSAASHPHAAYVAGRSDGRVYRRVGRGRWEWVVDGWLDPPSTIAPLLRGGTVPGELWAADERGIHQSENGGASWRRVAGYPATPSQIRGLVVVVE